MTTFIMSDTARTLSDEGLEEQCQKSVAVRPETIPDITPVVAPGFIVVYRPSDDQPVTFSRKSLSNWVLYKNILRGGYVIEVQHYVLKS